jgi:hypothetical protein
MAGMFSGGALDQPTMHDIQAQQGTRLKEKAPWETYGAEMSEKLDPKLAAEVEEYSQHRYADSKSSEAKEELCRQQELSGQVSKEYQWLTPEEYADIESRIGRVMNHGEFIGKLRDGCKLKCFYRDHPHADKITLVCTDTDGAQELQVACWVQNGYMPEYSIMRFDEHGVPLNERRRGWRTCLLQMILKGIINEKDVNRVFGRACGPASERYNKMLYGFRNEYKD